MPVNAVDMHWKIDADEIVAMSMQNIAKCKIFFIDLIIVYKLMGLFLHQ